MTGVGATGDLSIAGSVYVDSTKNGKRDTTEWKLDHALVSLIYHGTDGTQQGQVITTTPTFTKNGGSFYFGSLPWGYYSLEVDSPEVATVAGAQKATVSNGLVMLDPGGFVPTTTTSTLQSAIAFVNPSTGTTLPASTSLFGTMNSNRVDSIFLPDPATFGVANYNVTGYNFGEYQKITLPASNTYNATTVQSTFTLGNPSAVPEPTMLGMLGVGGLGLFGFVRLRRRRQAV
jgi:hypothetical protein